MAPLQLALILFSLVQGGEEREKESDADGGGGRVQFLSRGGSEGEGAQWVRGCPWVGRGGSKALSSGVCRGVNSARGAIATLAAAATLQTCLECPFTRTIANKLLHWNLQECNSLSTIANYG